MPAIELSPNEKYLSRRIDKLEDMIEDTRNKLEKIGEVLTNLGHIVKDMIDDKYRK